MLGLHRAWRSFQSLVYMFMQYRCLYQSDYRRAVYGAVGSEPGFLFSLILQLQRDAERPAVQHIATIGACTQFIRALLMRSA